MVRALSVYRRSRSFRHETEAGFRMKDAVLVTGGAGYVGSHTVYRMLEAGRRVVVLDDLSTGHREVTVLFDTVYGPEQFCFEEVSLLDPGSLDQVFDRHGITGIIDFAAKSLVAESQAEPRPYFETNVLGFRNLIAAAGGVPIVKSSTCAVYGEPDSTEVPISEDYPERCARSSGVGSSCLMPADVDFDTLVDWYSCEVAGDCGAMGLTAEDLEVLKFPTNVYGVTKRMDELILSKTSREGGSKHICLRYFNVAGAHRSRLIGEDHDPETHIIPIVLQVAQGIRKAVTVFGTDYATHDGTAVRDYISVDDLAAAHVACLDHLLDGGETGTYNLGTGTGASVRQVIEAARRVTGHEIPEQTGPRRSGDPAELVADASRIGGALGWEAESALEDMVASAWDWHRLNPEGYRIAQEERFNPFWGRWVNIAAHRGSRPWRGERQTLTAQEGATHDPACYLCPGNRRALGEVNPAYSGVWTFSNDFPTLAPDGYEIQEEIGPYAARTSRGTCEVISYSGDHSQRLSTLRSSEVVEVVDAWARIYERLGSQEGIRYVLIFENRGEIMGNSQLHPHGQVYAYGDVPDLMVEAQIRMFRQYRNRGGDACFVCDANRVEVEDGRRVVAANDAFVAYVPFAAQFPYDVMIVPLAHVGSLLELEPVARRDLGEIVREVLGGLDRLFDVPYHYSLALIQAPTDGTDHGYHMQIHITSLLRGPGLRKHVVGADIFGRIINPSDPNHSAAEIRRAVRRTDARC